MVTRPSEDIKPRTSFTEVSGPWTDLALTLPIFVGYHLGVVFLPVRNAADVVTRELVALADNNLAAYGGLTFGIGVLYVAILVLLGRGRALQPDRFVLIILEAAAYAVAMRLIAGYVVGRVFLGPVTTEDRLTGLIMSLGAGFYEEAAFRVLLYGVGSRVLILMFPLLLPFRSLILRVAWMLVAAAVFSAWHHLGALGEAFEPRSFVFRWVCGVVFTLIYVFRGFAPAVWTHALYDIWVLVL